MRGSGPHARRRLSRTQIKTLLFGAIAGAVVLAAGVGLLMPERYTASALLYITPVAQAQSEPSTAQRLADTVRIAVTTDRMLTQTADALGGRLTVDQLADGLDVDCIKNTYFLRLSMTCDEGVLAQEACSALAQTALVAFADTGDTGKITLFEAPATAEKTSLSLWAAALIGVVAGVLLAAVWLLIDGRPSPVVRRKDELRERLGVPVLGEIPALEPTAKGGRRHG